MKTILYSILFFGFGIKGNAQLNILSTGFFIESSTTVTVIGDITSNTDIQETGTLLLRGSLMQQVDIGGFVIPKLELDNTSNISFTGNAVIGNNLLFTNGNAQLNNSDLRIASAATISNTFNARFVITNGTGRLIKSSQAANAFSYPVGFSATEFNPVLISNSGTIDDIGVRCLQHVLDQGLAGSSVTTDVADNSWVITEEVAGGSNLSETSEWVAGDELGGFMRERSGIVRYNTGTDWDLPPSNVAAASGSNPYSRSRSNITSPGVFAVADLDKVNAARLNLKVFLQGNYNSGTGLMSDLLRDEPATGPIDPVIPTIQPYNAALNPKFTRVGLYNGLPPVNETVNSTIFDVTGNNAIVINFKKHEKVYFIFC